MSVASANGKDAGSARNGPRLSVAGLQRGTLWLLAASSFLVFIEPAPYELVFALLFAVFAVTGLRIAVELLPLIILLALYNLGGAMALVPVADNVRSVWFVAISAYMALSAIVVAAILSEDTLARLGAIQRGYVAAAVAASITGIMGYFDVAGTAELFSRFGRAVGTFKDPNVTGSFLVLPFVYLAHGLLIGSHRRPFAALLALAVVACGIFLSFSRGAWIVAAGAVLLAIGLTFLTTPSTKLRARLVLLAAIGAALLALTVVTALQFDSVRTMFENRATLDQSYDVGETGRFGNQRRAIPMLLERPNGFGPLIFPEIFPEDPHNTFLNAFAAYGWLGGFSYFALILSTLYVGWSLIVRASPWRNEAIVLWSAFFMLILQGVQIDTDHWRHWYLMLGITWGMAVARRRWEGNRAIGSRQ